MTVSSIVIPVKDVDTATAFYRTAFGAEPHTETPYYVGFRVGDQELGLDPNGHHKGMSAPLAYVEVDDIQGRLDQLLEAGAETQQPITDVGGGKLIASVRDADGNVTGLAQTP